LSALSRFLITAQGSAAQLGKNKKKFTVFPVFPRMSRNPDKDNIVSDNADWKLAYEQNYN
jgi:hypothetical protein